MPTKPRFFDLDFYYHIYNCGVERRDIFLQTHDYHRLLDTISFYLFKQSIAYSQYLELTAEAKQAYNTLNPKGLEKLRVKLVSFCLMPNHFHLLVKPVWENGITQFVSDISNSYTRYFNIKYERLGRLFQGIFKSKEITTEQSLLQVSRYIHLNPVKSTKTNPLGSFRNPADYPFSSYQEWAGMSKVGLTLPEEVSRWLDYVGGRKAYKDFVEAKIDQSVAVGIEDLIIEID